VEASFLALGDEDGGDQPIKCSSPYLIIKPKLPNEFTFSSLL